MEIFIVINSFNNYAISNYGRIFNLKKKTYITPVLNENGQLVYTFCQNNFKKTFKIDRLVALYFLENEEQKNSIKHKDNNLLNNKVDDLEWTEDKGNKIIFAKSIINDKTYCFESINEASSFLNIKRNNILKVLQNKMKTTNNYKFSFNKII